MVNGHGVSAMRIKHHITRKFNDAKQAPLWKWVVVILLVIAIPLFYSFIRATQIQQVFGN